MVIIIQGSDILLDGGKIAVSQACCCCGPCSGQGDCDHSEGCICCDGECVLEDDIPEGICCGPCDEGNPCPEGCACVDGQCVPENVVAECCVDSIAIPFGPECDCPESHRHGVDLARFPNIHCYRYRNGCDDECRTNTIRPDGTIIYCQPQNEPPYFFDVFPGDDPAFWCENQPKAACDQENPFP